MTGQVAGNRVNYTRMGCIHTTILGATVIKLFVSEFQVELIKIRRMRAWIRGVIVANSWDLRRDVS